ncbi:ABC transporter substrate-binding protein [Terasakiella pusilla]|uniref:ABC transporter substrate-binding protein n=1 Tax=Terasakiella pusilla TaxID=64973 RepID=UPI003AA90195
MCVRSIKRLVWLLGIAVLLVSSPLCAQQAKVLIVYSQIAEPYTTFMQHFHEALKDADISYQTINLNNREKIVERLLSDHASETPDALVAVGTVALRAIRTQKVLDSQIPVFFGMVSDPIGEGVIDAFNAPPKGHFTGVSFSIDIRDRLRDLKRLLPAAKKIGVIYSTMPQSVSYKKWIDEVAGEAEFKDFRFIFRRIGMRPYKDGPTDMVHTAKRHVQDIKDVVDVYLSPNDQMGILPKFAQMVVRDTGKPVFGLARKDVQAPKAAFASSAPRLSSAGEKLAQQLSDYLAGADFKTLHPTQPEYDLIINQQTADLFKISTVGF